MTLYNSISCDFKRLIELNILFDYVLIAPSDEWVEQLANDKDLQIGDIHYFDALVVEPITVNKVIAKKGPTDLVILKKSTALMMDLRGLQKNCWMDKNIIYPFPNSYIRNDFFTEI